MYASLIAFGLVLPFAVLEVIVAIGWLWRPISCSRKAAQESVARVTFVAMLVLFVAAPPVVGQTRFEDVRIVLADSRVSWLTDQRHDPRRAVLVVDTAGGQVQIDVDGKRWLDVPLAAVSALHYGESRYPPRLFGRSAPYLTIHYRGDDGTAAFAVLRVSSESAPRLLDEVGRATARPIDRSASTTSFLALPIHLDPKRPVRLTDTAGRRVTGRVMAFSPTSIEIGSGRFDAASISRIEVVDSLGNGIYNGALFLGYPIALALWGRNYCDDCASLPSVAGGLAIGAGIGVLIDLRLLRSAYRATPGSGTRVQVRPTVDRHLRMLQVSCSF